MDDVTEVVSQSPEIAKLVTALAKVQGELRGYREDSDNPFFKSKYGDLSSVWAAVRKPLADNGLVIIQTPVDSNGDGRIRLRTVLAHISGEWISGVLALLPKKDDPQAAGSAITYARRYSLAAIVGVAPEDDDGNAASAKDDPPPKSKPNPQQKADNETKERNTSAVAELYNAATAATMTDDEWKSMVDSIGIKKDKRTHTTERLAQLRMDVDAFISLQKGNG